MSIARNARKAANAVGQLTSALKSAVQESGSLASNVAAAHAGGGGPLGDAPLGQSPGTQRSRLFNIDARKTRLERLPGETFQLRFPENTIAERSDQVRGIAVVSRTADSIVVQAGIFGPTLTSDVYGSGEAFEGFIVVLTQGGPSRPQTGAGFIFDGNFYATDFGGGGRGTGGGDGQSSTGRSSGGGSGGRGRAGGIRFPGPGLSVPGGGIGLPGPPVPFGGGTGGGGPTSVSADGRAVVSAVERLERSILQTLRGDGGASIRGGL